MRTSRRMDLGMVVEALEPRRLLSWSFDPAAATVASVGDRAVSQVVVADFTGDGVPDLMAGAGRDLLLMRGRSDGGHDAAGVVLRLNLNVGLLGVADVNGDGRMDVVAAQNDGGLQGRAWVRVILNTGLGYRVDGLTRVMGRALGVVVGNIDADGREDVLVLAERRGEHFLDPSPRTLFWLEHSTGMLQTTGAAYSGAEFVGIPALVDLDHDGVQEVVLPTADVSVADTFNAVYGGRMSVMSAASGAWVEQSAVTFTGKADAVSVVDMNGDGHPEAAFGVRGLDQPLVSTGFNRVMLADLSAGNIGPPRMVMDRQQNGVVMYWVTDLRVIGAADVNGDGRMDLAVSALTFLSASTYVYRTDVLGTLVQRADGEFDEVAVRSTSASILNDGTKYESDRSGMVPFAVISARNGVGPAVAELFRAQTLTPPSGRESSSIQVLRTTAEWKTPTVAWMSFRKMTQSQTSQPFTRPGDRIRLRVFATQPEKSRGAGAAIVSLYRDSNGDGRWTSADELVALGQRLDPIVINAFTYPANYGTTTWGLDFVVPPSWSTSESAVTPQLFFVRIVDASGASSDPNDVRPVLYVNP